MPLASARTAAVSYYWGRVLDWRSPECHAAEWAAICAASVRTQQLAAMDAAVAAFAVAHPLTAALASLTALKAEILAGVPTDAEIAVELQAVIDALALDVVPTSAALIALVDA